MKKIISLFSLIVCCGFSGAQAQEQEDLGYVVYAHPGIKELRYYYDYVSYTFEKGLVEKIKKINYDDNKNIISVVTNSGYVIQRKFYSDEKFNDARFRLEDSDFSVDVSACAEVNKNDAYKLDFSSCTDKKASLVYTPDVKSNLNKKTYEELKESISNKSFTATFTSSGTRNTP